MVLGQASNFAPFLKISSSGDSRNQSEAHYCFIEFSDGEQALNYSEKVGVINAGSITQKLRGRFQHVHQWRSVKPVYKGVGGNEDRIESMFNSGSICFFPSSRHEKPHWINSQAVLDEMVFGEYLRHHGDLEKPLIVERACDSNLRWLMDVMLDSMLDVDLIEDRTTDSQSSYSLDTPRRSVSETHMLQAGRKNVEILLKEIMEDEHAQLFVNYRNAVFGRLGIRLGNGIVVPSLRHLSAGQSILFNMFATIIRYAEADGNLAKSVSLDQIYGIVLIDEIDSHLHTDLQYQVLPQLLKLFPKVQFVVSSHSPLFLLGMERVFGVDGVQFVELPLGRRITAERFEELKKAIDVFSQTKVFEDEIEKQIGVATKPLVLTEGQTDPTYLTQALALLGHADLLGSIEISQVGTSGKSGSTGGGDSHLQKAKVFLEHNASRFHRKVLLLFDNDTNKQAEDFGEMLFQRSIPKNPNNQKVLNGIENLLPENLFEDRFYKRIEKPKGDGGSVVTSILMKSDLCNWVCYERSNPSDFIAFQD